MTTNRSQVFHCVKYADADRGLVFLTQIGFTEVLVVRNENDLSVIEHAELCWRDNGGIMMGSLRDDNTNGANEVAGHSVCYLVVPTDVEVDQVFAQAMSAGAESIESPADRSFGGRMATVADPEGNLWSFGSYAGK